MLMLFFHIQQELFKLLTGIHPKASLCFIVYSQVQRNVSVDNRLHIQPVSYNGAKKPPQPGDIMVLTRRVPSGSPEASLQLRPCGRLEPAAEVVETATKSY